MVKSQIELDRQGGECKVSDYVFGDQNAINREFLGVRI